MPQMKPMNWLFLFIMMNLILIFINIMNYFIIKFPFLNNKFNLKKNNKIWKW